MDHLEEEEERIPEKSGERRGEDGPGLEFDLGSGKKLRKRRDTAKRN